MASNRPRFWFLLEGSIFFIGAMLFVYRFMFPCDGARSESKRNRLIVLMMIWLAYIAMQLAPWPGFLLEAVNPNAHQIQSYIGEGDAYYSISLNRYETFDMLLRYAAYVLIFFIIVELFGYVELKKLIYCMAAIGTLICAYGLIEMYLTSSDFVKGTYTNRNHFALFCVAILSLILGMIISHRRPGPNRKNLLSWLNDLNQGNVLLYFALVLVLATLFKTTSRGGFLAFGVGFTLTFLLVVTLRKDNALERSLLPLLLICAVGAAVWLGAGSIAQRIVLLQSTAEMDERWLMWASSVRLFLDYPIFGSGAGSYETVMSMYRNAEFRPLGYDHAHNDYIELLCELGIFGFSIVSITIVTWYVTVLKKYRLRNDRFVRGMVFSSLMFVNVMLLHGFLDFNFHTPANALYFFVMLGIGVAAVHTQRRSTNRIEH